MNTHKIILLSLISAVLLVSLVGAIGDYFKHKRITRLLGAITALALIYGTILYLAYHG